MKKSVMLKYMDVSFNVLGNKELPHGDLAEGIADILNENSLRHFDMSYNNIDHTEMRIFGKLIEKNHYVFGLHILGNAAGIYIDERGFVRSNKNDPV